MPGPVSTEDLWLLFQLFCRQPTSSCAAMVTIVLYLAFVSWLAFGICHLDIHPAGLAATAHVFQCIDHAANQTSPDAHASTARLC